MTVAHYARWRYDMLRHWPRVKRYVKPGAHMVEVGTWKGASAVRWLKRFPSRLWLVDPYREKNDASWESLPQAELDKVRRTAHALVTLADRRGVARFIRLDSVEAAEGFADESLDAVYIDGDHSREAVEADLAAWWPKLAAGGVVVLDDHLLGRWWHDGVIAACAAFKPIDEAWRRQHGRWLAIGKERDA